MLAVYKENVLPLTGVPTHLCSQIRVPVSCGGGYDEVREYNGRVEKCIFLIFSQYTGMLMLLK